MRKLWEVTMILYNELIILVGFKQGKVFGGVFLVSFFGWGGKVCARWGLVWLVMCRNWVNIVKAYHTDRFPPMDTDPPSCTNTPSAYVAP